MCYKLFKKLSFDLKLIAEFNGFNVNMIWLELKRGWTVLLGHTLHLFSLQAKCKCDVICKCSLEWWRPCTGLIDSGSPD